MLIDTRGALKPLKGKEAIIAKAVGMFAMVFATYMVMIVLAGLDRDLWRYDTFEADSYRQGVLYVIIGVVGFVCGLIWAADNQWGWWSIIGGILGIIAGLAAVELIILFAAWWAYADMPRLLTLLFWAVVPAWCAALCVVGFNYRRPRLHAYRFGVHVAFAGLWAVMLGTLLCRGLLYDIGVYIGQHALLG